MQLFKKLRLLGVWLCVLLTSTVYAHPLDISSSTFTLHETSIDGITYLHPSQVEAILWKRWLSMRALTYGDYYTYKAYLFDYVSQKVAISLENTLCKIWDFSTTDLGVDEIFTSGFPVRYSVACPKKIDAFNLKVDIFTDLPLQTNRVLFYDGKTGNRLFYKVLTAKQTSFDYTPWVKIQAIDTDWDGLSDEEEKLYRTDPAKKDTDSDHYSDYEEVMSGWNSISANISPGQSKRMEDSTAAFSLPTNITQSGDGVVPGDYSSQQASSDSDVQKWPITLASNDETLYSLFKKILSRIDTLRTWEADVLGIGLVLALLMMLGFLHALGPGHSKGFLVGYILAQWATMGSSVLYALIFTCIHLADIVIITLLAKFVFRFFDPAEFLGKIEMYGAWGLLMLSIVLFVTALRLLKRQKQTGLERVKPSRKGLWLAFFAGLAPCTFAWSIVLVLFAIGRMEFALPFLLAFGLGVFTCLGTLAIVTFRMREKIYSFDGRLAYYSPLVSSLFIFGLAVFFLLRFL